MTGDEEIQNFENELRNLRPAKPRPAPLLRLAQQLEESQRRSIEAATAVPAGSSWRSVLRWLIPATGAALVIVLVTSGVWHGGLNGDYKEAVAERTPPAIQADQVHIDQELVAAFQTVAESPDGVPIRFELQEWMDRVTFRDTRQGITVERTSPRVEIVPVRYESY